MNPKLPDIGQTSRREMLCGAMLTAAAIGFKGPSAHGAVPASGPNVDQPHPTPNPEWRNQHPDMAYRMLGRTGFMVSEIVCGGYLMKPDMVGLYEAALDRGLNYLDQAAAYGNGEGEQTVAALLKRGIARDRFFLTTKLSHYNGFVRRRYEERFKSLPGGQQQEIQKLAEVLLADSRNTRPGYHVNYFNGQESPFTGAYRVNAMRQLGIPVDSKAFFERKIDEMLESGMKRAGVDHFDVLFCPHSVETPASFDDEAMINRLATFKAEGKARSLGFSAHNDTGANLQAGVTTGRYDVAMVAYNIVNHLAMDPIVAAAADAGVGVIAMKAARPVIIDPIPWRLAKLDTMIDEPTLSTAQKAYLFVLQNPNLSAVISDMKDVQMLRENAALAGKKATLRLI